MTILEMETLKALLTEHHPKIDFDEAWIYKVGICNIEMHLSGFESGSKKTTYRLKTYEKYKLAVAVDIDSNPQYVFFRELFYWERGGARKRKICGNCKYWVRSFHVKFEEDQVRGRCKSENLLFDYRLYYGRKFSNIVETESGFWCRYFEGRDGG
jgi:hypothetical protein